MGHTEVNKPGFLYYPSELNLVPDKGGKGRWVHLVSLGLQLAQKVCTIAALTDSEIEAIMDHHLMLWVRAKSWSESRPFVPNKELNLCYEDSFEGKFATISLTEIELAEAFLDQEDEGAPELPDHPDPEDDTLEDGVIVARPAPSIHDKPKPKDQKRNEKGKGRGKRADSKGRSQTPGRPPVTTRSACIMPTNRYPVAVSGTYNALNDEHYSVFFDVLRAVQSGAVFSPAIDKAGSLRGYHVTSRISANAMCRYEPLIELRCHHWRHIMLRCQSEMVKNHQCSSGVP